MTLSCCPWSNDLLSFGFKSMGHANGSLEMKGKEWFNYCVSKLYTVTYFVYEGVGDSPNEPLDRIILLRLKKMDRKKRQH